MKIGIIGLPQTGKKTLFELISNYKPTEGDGASGKPLKAIAEIKDPRFDKLVAMYNPAKATRARIDIELLPRLEKDTIAKGDIFSDIDDLDAICHVVRTFKNDSVYHIEGSVNPKRDIESVNAELILHDLVFIEKRMERLDKTIKKLREKADAEEKELLLKFKEHLEKDLPLRTLALSAAEKKIIPSYPFVTLKNMLIVLNVSENVMTDNTLAEELRRDYTNAAIEIMQVSVKVEAEIARLESKAERKEFFAAHGIEEPAINVLTRLCMKALRLMSFFTVGEDEVRQWTIRTNSTAPVAAGAIHSDLEKGFIRAEVIKYGNLISAGSEEKVKAAGKFYLKGKDYIVEDGDIMGIRFNV